MSLERSWDLAEEAERNALGIKVARDREFCECNAEQVRKQAKRSFETMLDDCMWNGDCETEPMSAVFSVCQKCRPDMAEDLRKFSKQWNKNKATGADHFLGVGCRLAAEPHLYQAWRW